MADLDLIYDIDHRHEAFEVHREGVLACVAGPGTGKTFCLLAHIKSLTADGVSPRTICYLTFIKEIARAFISDYNEAFADQIEGEDRPRVSTLHSFACRLIRNRGFAIGLDGPLYFASVAEKSAKSSDLFVSDLLPMVVTLGPDTPARLRGTLETIKEAWRKGDDPRSLPEPLPAVLERALALGKGYRLVDWDQAIPLAHTLFSNPAHRRQWLTELKYFLVDEYQDFNIAEQRFISAIASTAASMIVVGDDNQSIYGSQRDANPDGLRILFAGEDNDTVSLLVCRRSRARILQAANTLLCSMCSGVKPMIPSRLGGQMECYRFKSCKAEVQFLVEFLSERVDELPSEPRSKDGIVCLFHSWKALDFYYDQIASNVPCFKRKWLLDPQRQWLRQALQLVCNPQQRYIQRILLEDVPEIKPRHKKAMVKLILERDISPQEAVKALLGDGVLRGAAVEPAGAFIELCEALSSQNADCIGDHVAAQLGVDPACAREQLHELLLVLGDVDQDDAIEACCDGILPDSVGPVEDPRAVLFLTMHGSKGLTKGTVVMPGLEDARLPGVVSGAGLDESRRLFYVALTRATDRVLITYPKTRARGDPLNYDSPGKGEVCRFSTESGISDTYHK